MRWIIYICFCYLMLGTIFDLNRMLHASKVEDSANCGGIKSCVKCVLRSAAKQGDMDVDVVSSSLQSKNANMVMAGSAYRCVKCTHLIVMKSRQCVSDCPVGYVEEWSTLVDYMGRVCRESMIVAGIPLTGQKFTIVLGASVGILVCVILVTSGGIYLKYRRKKYLNSSSSSRQSPSLGHLTGTHRSQDSDDSERPEFLKQLAFLRPDAAIFLAMLNETRKQIRESHRSTRQNSTLQAYKPVLKDLSRILLLLNRPEDRLGAPPNDWETLLAWGERVLRRYKKQNPDQIAQLLGFSQLPLEEPESPILGHSPYPAQLTTFQASSGNSSNNDNSEVAATGGKHLSSSESSNHLQQLAISAFDAAYNHKNRRSNNETDGDELAVLHRNEVSSMFVRGPANYFTTADECNVDCKKKELHSIGVMTHSEWTTLKHNRNNIRNYYLASGEEDDFHTLGFRPQDEITTEL